MSADPSAHEPTEPATRRGRERYDRILNVATDVFLEHGFEAASMSEIGRRAGGSMATLYRFFSSKEALFQAIIERNAPPVYEPMEADGILQQPPEEALFALGMRLNELLLTRHSLLVHRVVLAEGHRNPALREIFYRHGPGRTQAALAAYLREQVARGHLEIADCDAAAAQFLELAKGEFSLSIMLGQPPDVDRARIEASVRQAVGIFLHGTAGSRSGTG